MREGVKGSENQSKFLDRCKNVKLDVISPKPKI